jgi:hypothetical protein
MLIKEITVGGSRTINLGNYNSIKLEGSCTVAIHEHEQDEVFLELARATAINEVKTQLKEAYAALKPKEKA